MNRFMSVTTIGVIVLWQCSTLSTFAQNPRPSAASLETLRSRTGWIALGNVTVDGKRWAAGSDPNVAFLTGGYEIVGKAVDRRTPVLPKIGDRIRLTASNEVIILDYTTSGEERVLDAPSAVRRSLGDGDRPGIRLAAATLLMVEDIKVSPPHGPMRTIWARVSPVSK